jgi:hypothetical protein
VNDQLPFPPNVRRTWLFCQAAAWKRLKSIDVAPKLDLVERGGGLTGVLEGACHAVRGSAD